MKKWLLSAPSVLLSVNYLNTENSVLPKLVQRMFLIVNLFGILAVAFILVLGKGFPQHFAADKGQKDKGDPMVDGSDDAHELTAKL